MKKRVLVFPCGSEIGLEIYRSLSFSTHIELLGGSSEPDHGEFVYQNYVGGLPYVSDAGFIKEINDLVKTQKVDFIFPAHDSVVLKLAEAKAAGDLECELITSPLETCVVARSKQKTYERLKGVVPTPEIYASVADVTDAVLPVFLKPDVGQGSKGTYLAKTTTEIEHYTKQDPSLLLLEYLPGPEFTVDCFTNRQGELLFAEGRRRDRISNGISVASSSVDDKRFKELAEKINKALTFKGVWFFQVKESVSKELVLMEIAPRVAGTMGLVRCKGVNLPLLSLFDAMGYDAAIVENDYQISIDRALENRYRHNIQYSHAYFDFDDLLIFEGQVNPIIMAFVYQCINNKVKTHLITKHRDDLHKNLERYHLQDVFDDIIWIKPDDEKHTYIKEMDAIFIDDSFAERKDIKEKCNIPVFDSHMVESLMESFNT